MASLNAASAQVSQAFSSFSSGFQNARNSVLFNSSSTDMAANQAQFNSQLSNGLIAFSTNLSTALGSLRGATSSLQPSIVASLFGVGNGNGGSAAQLGVTTKSVTAGAASAQSSMGSAHTSAIYPPGYQQTPTTTNNPLQYVVDTRGSGASTSAISPPGTPAVSDGSNPFQYLVETRGSATPTGVTTGSSGDLFSMLSSLPTPTDTSGLSAQQYNTAAFSALNSTFSNIQGRLNVFGQNPNFNFSPFNSISNATSPFFNSGGLFTPPTSGSSSSTPFFNGGFFDNTFSPAASTTGSRPPRASARRASTRSSGRIA